MTRKEEKKWCSQHNLCKPIFHRITNDVRTYVDSLNAQKGSFLMSIRSKTVKKKLDLRKAIKRKMLYFDVLYVKTVNIQKNILMKTPLQRRIKLRLYLITISAILQIWLHNIRIK